jgi:hypothetical protein
MKNINTFAVCIILFAIFIISCDGVTSSGNYKSFDSKLRRIWVSKDPSLDSYSGTLKIEIDTITIDGYREDWLSVVGDDIKRPFKDYPKKVPLKGYSQDGQIFIEYGGAQDGIPYTYTETGTYPDKYKLLSFDFGGRKEILQYPMDY